jgi:hypothetical protein
MPSIPEKKPRYQRVRMNTFPGKRGDMLKHKSYILYRLQLLT